MKTVSLSWVRACICIGIMALIASPQAFAQSPDRQTDRMATFRGGGAKEFSRWVNNHVSYPRAALKKSVEGEVVYSFVVDKDGRVKDVRIVKSPAQELSDEVIRVLEKAPRWEPAVQDGKPVNIKFQSSVIFIPPR